jgi:hypothetical protein
MAGKPWETRTFQTRGYTFEAPLGEWRRLRLARNAPPPQDIGPKDWTQTAPSCPPDTQLHARGGYVWDAYAGNGWWAYPMDADFGVGGNVQVLPFANAGWYRGVLVTRYGGGTSPNHYETDEYATAAEAQDAVIAMITTGTMYQTDLPLALLVVKNDGTTGVAGAILPIDAVNRGRSYLFREVRPWLHIHYQGPE